MMQPKLLNVKPLKNYRLLLHYDNGEQKVFDVKPYIKGDWYGKLSDLAIFNMVKVVDGWTVEWNEGQDISPEDLYELSCEYSFEEK